MRPHLPILLSLLATPVLAEEKRELDSHVHGVGELNVAVAGDTVAMEFHAPGADIVGFEYAAETAEDRAVIADAIAVLARPLDLFVLPAAAECSVVEASAELELDDSHDEHGHDDHDHDKDVAEHDHDEHGHDKDHAGHDDHEHKEHADAPGHTEFHAEYAMTCGNIGALKSITFAYFDTFENAQEVEVQIITASGAQAFEVERDAPELDLRGMF